MTERPDEITLRERDLDLASERPAAARFIVAAYRHTADRLGAADGHVTRAAAKVEKITQEAKVSVAAAREARRQATADRDAVAAELARLRELVGRLGPEELERLDLAGPVTEAQAEVAAVEARGG